MTDRQFKIALRAMSNAAARAQQQTPHGTAREVCAFLKLVEKEMTRA
jgi:hypothetical protein